MNLDIPGSPRPKPGTSFDFPNSHEATLNPSSPHKETEQGLSKTSENRVPNIPTIQLPASITDVAMRDESSKIFEYQSEKDSVKVATNGNHLRHPTIETTGPKLSKELEA